MRASMCPWYPASVVAGELAAPPITQSNAESGVHGWAASQPIPLANGVTAVVVLA